MDATLDLKLDQEDYLSGIFNQLRDLINEVERKYKNRISKTHFSIEKIFDSKFSKVQSFEKELSELERDVRLNYYNIIKLMDIDPFYEIIFRYTSKLNKIRNVFLAFKNTPKEIPELALTVKSV